MKQSDRDMQVRMFEQEAKTDQDMELMVPPLWSNSTYRVVAGVVVVLLIIGVGIAFWG